MIRFSTLTHWIAAWAGATILMSGSLSALDRSASADAHVHAVPVNAVAQDTTKKSPLPLPATARDSAQKDSTRRANRQRREAEALANQGMSTKKKALIAVGILALLGVMYGAYVIIRGPRADAEREIPIIFQPREHVPEVAEFPSARARAPAMQYTPPPIPMSNDGNHRLPEVHAPAPNPSQGTLQILPGRLEVASGMAKQKEIRFVRVPGKAEVTFGRYAGEPNSHIQIDSPTVSRKHASMRFHLNRWHITNLSSTNPVIVNGEQLPADEERPLSDGDQVEMGEVVFRFHAR